MAEVSIHSQHHDADGFGRGVGVLVGSIGILLAVTTIGAHRTHTAAIITRTEANDKWAFYQAKKERAHLQDVGAVLLETLGSEPVRTQPAIAKFRADEQRYQLEAEALNQEARALEADVQRKERRALRLDLGEGFLELGLVLSSLYFLARRRFFPYFGASAAVIGVAVALWSLAP